MSTPRLAAGEHGIDYGVEFAQLFARYHLALRRYIHTMLPRNADTDEVMQRTTAALWERFTEYDRSREFLPWAIQMTFYEVLNFRKEFARSKLLFNDDVVEALADERPEYDPQHDIRLVALEKCLEVVSTEGRTLLQRRYCDSESLAELAVELGLTPKSLYRRLDRLRASIAECVHNRMRGVPHGS